MIDNPDAEIEVFAKIDIMDEIAQCESGDRHFLGDGRVIRGRKNPLDIGRYQINLKYHGEKAEELGFNLFSEEGNEAYAMWLYNKEGTEPWRHSSHCWK